MLSVTSVLWGRLSMTVLGDMFSMTTAGRQAVLDLCAGRQVVTSVLDGRLMASLCWKAGCLRPLHWKTGCSWTFVMHPTQGYLFLTTASWSIDWQKAVPTVHSSRQWPTFYETCNFLEYIHEISPQISHNITDLAKYSHLLSWASREARDSLSHDLTMRISYSWYCAHVMINST